MKLLVTADLHYNNPRSRRLADDLIERMNGEAADVLLLVGDTAGSDGTLLEECLTRFRFAGPKLFVCGNHEFWTHGPDSHALFRGELCARVRAAGWHWLEDEPFVMGDVAVVGSVGWYDYSYANAELGIPRRFYEAKVSPGAAGHFTEHAHLLTPADDISEQAREIYARWNDGRFVKLGMSDEAFVEELLASLEEQLQRLSGIRHLALAIHHVPFAELLPPPGRAQWEFARAFLGSGRFGELLKRYANVRMVLCGHSHWGVEANIGGIQAINIGSGYRAKVYRVLELG